MSYYTEPHSQVYFALFLAVGWARVFSLIFGLPVASELEGAA